MANGINRIRDRAVAICAFAGLLAVGASVATGDDKPDPDKGNEIFDEQCSQCHYSAKVDRKTGPGLKLLFARAKLQSNGKPMTDANVLEKIEKGGNGMPGFKETLAANDKADLIAYLKTL